MNLSRKDLPFATLLSFGLSLALGACSSDQVEKEPIVESTRQEHKKPPSPETAIYRWNEIMLDADALDHTPVSPGEDRVFGEQFGPTRSSRAFAIVQIAVFDAYNAIERGFESYTKIDGVHGPASPVAAIAQAAHDTLVALYPSQSPRFDTALEEDLARLPWSQERKNGVELGKRAAAAILALRANDNSQLPDPVVGKEFFPSKAPGKWRPDPITNFPLAVGARWPKVPPFVLRSAEQFRVPKPPPLTSAEYARAFDEVKRLGGDGITTPTERTPEQTIIGIYWAYDKAPKIGTPPRMLNQIATVIAKQQGTTDLDLARLYALVNVAMADAAISCWNAKYDYELWRPITGIREADPGTGPTGKGDGNPATQGAPSWTPLGSPASNTDGDPNFTPPFPAYVSGHATFAGAFFQVLRRFYGTDDIRFTFVSDELNGITRDNMGNVRPRIPRTFSTLSQAEEEDGQSRIYLGVHWQFDKVEGIRNGRSVGDFVFDNAFERLRKRHDGHDRHDRGRDRDRGRGHGHGKGHGKNKKKWH